MAIEYGILFPSNAPDLELELQLTAESKSYELTKEEKGAGFWLSTSEEIFLYISAGLVPVKEELKSLEFSFGHYWYKTSWYVRCGPDSYGAFLILLGLITELLVDYEDDFLCMVNGERVVIQKIGEGIYLNQMFGSWNKQEVQDALSSVSYELVNYPVV